MIGFILAIALSITTLGTHGNVYDIYEQDAMQEIEQRGQNADTEKLRSDLKNKFKNYKPKDMSALDPAEKTYSYLVDMTQSIPFDIPEVDQDGKKIGILYEKGTRLNPLEYLSVAPPPMIIFNGNSRKELKWVKHYYKGKAGYMFVITEGDWIKISEELGVQVYYLKEMMTEKFQLKNTVSVVSVALNEKKVKVDVYAVN